MRDGKETLGTVIFLFVVVTVTGVLLSSVISQNADRVERQAQAAARNMDHEALRRWKAFVEREQAEERSMLTGGKRRCDH